MVQPPLPPGPPGRPLVGVAPEFARDPLGFLSRAARQYGDVVGFRLGRERMVLVSRPEDIEEVLVRRAEDFRKSHSLRVEGRLLFGSALTAAEGASWARQRRLSAPAFHREPMAAYAEIAVRCASGALSTWRDGEIRAFDQDVRRLMIEIGCRAFLGVDPAGEADGIGQAIAWALRGFDERVRSVLPTPDWIPVRANRLMRRGMGRIHALVERTIAERRRSGEDRSDLLSRLLSARDEEGGGGMRDEAIRDEIAVMFALGGHQTAVGLSWAFHRLSQHPEAERRLHAELDEVLGGRAPTPDDVPRLVFTRRVVEETLRLDPPFYLIGREARVDGTIGGYRIPHGVTLLLSPWVTQRSSRWFADPEAFRPERWADDLARRLPRFAYFPFGGGPRICIAAAHATLQMVLVLATVASRVRLEAVPGHLVVPRPSIVLGMRHGLRLTVRQRHRSERPVRGDRATSG